MAMDKDFKLDENNKWDAYSCIASSICKKHDLCEISSWLSDCSSELAQWSLRSGTGVGTPYKKNDIVEYIRIMNMVTLLLMSAHHKICEENKELYDMLEKAMIHEYYDRYCEDED